MSNTQRLTEVPLIANPSSINAIIETNGELKRFNLDNWTSSGTGNNNRYVSYDIQNGFSDSDKTNARNNIGAASQEDLRSIIAKEKIVNSLIDGVWGNGKISYNTNFNDIIPMINLNETSKIQFRKVSNFTPRFDKHCFAGSPETKGLIKIGGWLSEALSLNSSSSFEELLPFMLMPIPNMPAAIGFVQDDSSSSSEIPVCVIIYDDLISLSMNQDSNNSNDLENIPPLKAGCYFMEMVSTAGTPVIYCDSIFIEETIPSESTKGIYIDSSERKTLYVEYNSVENIMGYKDINLVEMIPVAAVETMQVLTRKDDGTIVEYNVTDLIEDTNNSTDTLKIFLDPSSNEPLLTLNLFLIMPNLCRLRVHKPLIALRSLDYEFQGICDYNYNANNFQTSIYTPMLELLSKSPETENGDMAPLIILLIYLAEIQATSPVADLTIDKNKQYQYIIDPDTGNIYAKICNGIEAEMFMEMISEETSEKNLSTPFFIFHYLGSDIPVEVDNSINIEEFFDTMLVPIIGSDDYFLNGLYILCDNKLDKESNMELMLRPGIKYYLTPYMSESNVYIAFGDSSNMIVYRDSEKTQPLGSSSDNGFASFGSLTPETMSLKGIQIKIVCEEGIFDCIGVGDNKIYSAIGTFATIIEEESTSTTE